MNLDSLWIPLLLGWCGCIGVMFALWLWATARRDASSVDVAWSALLGAVGVGFALTLDGPPQRRWLLGIIVGVWSVRLAGHLLIDRVLKAREEDGRYQELRASWGSAANRNFFVFFQAQGLLVAVLSLPFLIAARGPAQPGVLDLCAGLLWFVGIAGEAAADRQLAAWRADAANRGRTCRAGLWKYSRHPNYFFEWLMWCAYALLGTAAVAGDAAWWWAAACWTAPAIMLFSILKVTGIPPTEARALKSRGDDYRAYQRTTSAFFPWFPKGA